LRRKGQKSSTIRTLWKVVPRYVERNGLIQSRKI
jgi:hypothetical protein